MGSATRIGFIDSTSLKVCHNRRISLLNIALTTGNIDDRKPVRELIAYCHLLQKPSIAIDRLAI